MPVTCGDIPRLFCSVIIPAVGVFFLVGCSRIFLLNVVLVCLGYGASDVALSLF
ncbi:hypothetical protein BBO99_00006293 [Phytophthora kernoviae]|uniref:Uncharacterized protein n=1 Tax=Phytophthora kernoviae TaxID=325452 RepID=A0A3R7H6Y0_9STRA|nr:hypothetical protein JM16_006153 [Phytophthora kernoviae]RLN27028.1 hypothetical protein BBI17_006454 [Phytophthora kernoviae]RLN77987.1 hypothetical protein BBO99_00006293 [Phytophthora kernoviae]